MAADYVPENPHAIERDKRRMVVSFCRKLGQIKVKRIQSEFCKLTQQIGCPEFTRVHDLRHLFSSRAQEEGANPLLVQEILGHANLNMTKRYTHLGMDAKREAIERMTPVARIRIDGIGTDLLPDPGRDRVASPLSSEPLSRGIKRATSRFSSSWDDNWPAFSARTPIG